jgi:glucose/mannose transport system permease protein
LKRACPRWWWRPVSQQCAFFIYGFIIWTAYISLTKSSFLPVYDFAGFLQYEKLWQIPRWFVACKNLLIFSSLFILFCIVLGLLLAIFLDQRIRVEGTLRTIYLYPMALSFIVTGTAWKWILNPGLGLESWCANGAGPASALTGW